MYVLILLLCALATIALSVLLESKQFVYKQTNESSSLEIKVDPFPVSVDPIAQTILKEGVLDETVEENLVIVESKSDNLWSKVVAFFSKEAWYQNLASPISRIIVIWPGERKEEAVDSIGDVLAWDQAERDEFTRLITTTEPVISDGTFYPGQYVAHRGARPEEVARMIQESFQSEVLSRYTPEVELQVPLQDALTIASLLEREASDFENMREISGVIWNRLFIDMPLQLDATLQYVRGSRPSEAKWWPVPRPSDKFLTSPYNTYANKGLPPAPISNPSAEAVLAALNPVSTDCLFYFHNSSGDYFCSKTYEEHVQKLKVQYGRGK
jgi:cell division protein YceG involved in septum cleavage